MECSKCHQNSIIYQPYSGQHLCERHFVADVETKIKRVIRQNQWLKPGDNIGVLLSGGLESGALFSFLKELTHERRDIRISGFTPGPGKDQKLSEAKVTAIARENGFTGIAAGSTLDDFSQSVLADLLSGCKVWENRRADEGHGLFRWIFPFKAVSASEIALYARLCGAEDNRGHCAPEQDPFHNDVATLLSEYTNHHPATMHALMALGENISKTCGAGETYLFSPDRFQRDCKVEPPNGVDS